MRYTLYHFKKCIRILHFEYRRPSLFKMLKMYTLIIIMEYIYHSLGNYNSTQYNLLETHYILIYQFLSKHLFICLLTE